MAYALTLAQLNTNSGGLGRSNTFWGFPGPNIDFHTLLVNFWMCGPTSPSGGQSAIWPQFASANFFSLGEGTNGIVLTNYYTGDVYHGTFNRPLPLGTRHHIMFSADTHAQVVQLYIDDQMVPITGGTWLGTPPYNFNLGTTFGTPINIWAWNVNNVIFSYMHSGLGDVWIANPPSFVDLSVTANRRKFTNADLSPVDPGDTGTAPFGYQPALYMSVRPGGGVPADILLNRGVGGGSWNYDQDPPSFQAPDACTLPPPPPGGGDGGGGGGGGPPMLAIDNVNVAATATRLEVNLISLRWSDDRGHSWGSPVTQDIGEAGEYRTSLQWQRLAYARDRVFEISWSVPMRTALQGCWVDVTPAQS